MTVLEAALRYARAGLSVVPIPAGQKHPAIEWREYQSRRADADELRAWWAAHPGDGLAIITGQVSGGLVVLDVDPRNGGMESIAGKHQPPTPAVRTGGGGMHYYYRADRPLASRQLAPGLDFQAEGKLVVAPPSVHPNGNAYAWFEGMALGEVKGAPPPAWILEAAAAPGQLKPNDWRERTMAALFEGGRNVKLTQLAGYYLRNKMTPAEVLRILRALNAAECRPPLEDGELTHIVESIARKEAAKPQAAAPITEAAAAGGGAPVFREIHEATAPVIEVLERRHGGEIARIQADADALDADVGAGRLGAGEFDRRLGAIRAAWLALAAAVGPAGSAPAEEPAQGQTSLFAEEATTP